MNAPRPAHMQPAADMAVLDFCDVIGFILFFKRLVFAAFNIFDASERCLISGFIVLQTFSTFLAFVTEESASLGPSRSLLLQNCARPRDDRLAVASASAAPT